MRVLIAPDAFAGTLTAPEAARALAEGWRRRSPQDVLTLAPMADGGEGFVDVLHAALGGELLVMSAPGPCGVEVPVTVLRVGTTTHVESVQACAPSLLDAPDPWHATSVGVGTSIAAAVDGGARQVVVGLGGSASLDGGAGLLHALGATADVPLDRGPAGLRGITVIDLEPARERLAGVDLTIAADVSLPLLGMFGAARSSGPDHGLDDAQVLELDAVLDALVVAACGSTPSERRIADAKGAGAAGGAGFALLLLGGTVVSGIGLVAKATGLAERAAAHDLVVTGEGTFDHTSRAGKVVYGVAELAASAARPCIVLAGQVTVGARERRAMGVESAYAIEDLVRPEVVADGPHAALAALAERVARSWSTPDRRTME